ncbi:hypothetical protein PVAND_010490 [Polypedilum vanderplanki]|uniref:Beta-hexosaminidase n=1 Tax=Polypedilum vanderplanki TaxID=319348 RepID=A0A9J6CGR7_POLVA|nr:hypothetical protein PVAND_010490 [Polypedilum vanderplanki]
MFRLLLLYGFTLLSFIGLSLAQLEPSWGYKCEHNNCKKVELTADNKKTAVSLSVCRLYCNLDAIGTLWPKPTGIVQIGNDVVKISPNEITFKTESFKREPAYWSMATERFIAMQKKKLPFKYSIRSGGKSLIIEVTVESDDMVFTLDTYEGYKLKISENNDGVHAVITAKNFYGARNALESLSQLIVYDNIRNEILAVAAVEIEDEPKFKYRGILLDTSRNYFSIDSIKRTIEGMAMVKLNTFHWHITDSHSFPLVVKSQPELSKLGAYSPEKMYTPEDVEEVVRFAKARGIRVLPEFDAPAHVGEGWQHKDLTTCFNAQPWKDYCVEAPCGQLDPSKDEVYNVLEDIYREMIEHFQYPDIFHMGGDEVSVSCWNSSSSLQNWMIAKGWNLNESDFMKLWGYFQNNALERLDKANFKKVPIILWTSRLTEEPFLSQYLNNQRYIIQIWTKGDDPQVQTILEKGFKMIVSNYDALYLDCGFGAWVTEGNNWCSPYIGWQKIYDNRMETIAGSYVNQVYGAEAALWTEQVDEWTLDARLWPRVSAMAERLWSNPEDGWRAAESRMLVNRKRLVDIGGLSAERLQPEWCLQNEGDCPI